MIISLHCQDNTSLAVKYSTYWESVKGNRVSPWDGSPFDSVCKHRLNEKLEMRNGGAAPDPSTQFLLFRLYVIEHPTFHSAQDDEMRREA